MNKPYLPKFFLTDWRHKRLKIAIDLLLFYGEHFYGFSESERPDLLAIRLLRWCRLNIIHFG